MIELPIRPAVPDVSHVDALACGTRLGEFEILGLLGVGGFGMVYRAYDHSLQRDVAIKEYMPTALAGRTGNALNVSVRTSTDEETFQTGLRSFVGEARMLAKFEHPSLVRVFRFWEANGTAYMVMPLYRGMTLKQARQAMRMPPTEAWLRKVLWSILGALKVLHRGRAVHRDVSPDNIFLQDSGPPVLLDLGAARLAIGDNAKQHTAILKVNYAPIEQYADARGLPQGPWTDLYALAAVVHGLLCNEPPLPAMIRVVNDRLPPFPNVVKTLAAEFGQSYTEQFATGIAWALQIQPQDRPQSVREFARSLGLATPNGMSTFDWRAELGAACLPAGDVLQLSDARRVIEKTRPNRTGNDYATTQFIDADQDGDEVATIIAGWETDDASSESNGLTAERRNRPRIPIGETHVIENGATVQRTAAAAPAALAAKRSAPAPSQPTGVWLMVAALALSGLVAAFWGWRSLSARDRTTAPSPLSSQTLPDTPVAAVATPSAPGGSGIASAASEPMASPQAATDVAMAGPGQTVQVAAAPMTAASAAADKAAKAAVERARNKATRAAKVETPRTPAVTETAVEPDKAQAAPAEPDPKPKPMVPAVTPETVCADSNFLTRPMCMYRACQRPDLSKTATCVELEQRMKRDAEINRN